MINELRIRKDLEGNGDRLWFYVSAFRESLRRTIEPIKKVNDDEILVRYNAAPSARYRYFGAIGTIFRLTEQPPLVDEI
jgi:hypothetical protein